jgi:hypothetical protein
MSDEFGEEFVSKYIELYDKLSVFLNAKRLKQFDKQLTKGYERAHGYISWACDGVSGDVLLDLAHAHEFKSEEEKAAAADQAVYMFNAVMASIGLLLDLMVEAGGRKKVSKAFVKYRKKIRKTLAARGSADALEGDIGNEATQRRKKINEIITAARAKPVELPESEEVADAAPAP